MDKHNMSYFEKSCVTFSCRKKIVQAMPSVSRPFFLQIHILNCSQVSAKSNQPSPTGVPAAGPIQRVGVECGFPDVSPWSKGLPMKLRSSG